MSQLMGRRRSVPEEKWAKQRWLINMRQRRVNSTGVSVLPRSVTSSLCNLGEIPCVTSGPQFLSPSPRYLFLHLVVIRKNSICFHCGQCFGHSPHSNTQLILAHFILTLTLLKKFLPVPPFHRMMKMGHKGCQRLRGWS